MLTLGLLAVLAAPAQAQVDATQAQRLREFLDHAVAEQQAVGVVAMVMQRGQVVFSHAAGWADREAGRRMTTNTIFRIASQSKALTSVAAMILVEEGKLGLSEPISRWLPGFDSTTVSVPDSSAPGGARIVPARRQITVRDLLTHTAGMSYGREARLESLYAAQGLGPEAGIGWYFAHKNVDICTAIQPLARLPLAAQPGERFVYGYGTDVLGCVIERASGISLDRFIRERITAPLGMNDTGFCLDRSEADRIAAVYRPSGDTLVRAANGPTGQGDYVGGPCRAFSGGAGMVATAGDYARFLEMLRRGGTIDGVRILSPASVRLMVTDHLDDLYQGPAVGFGLGFEVYHEPAALGRYGRPGRWGWGGAYHSNYWVDPQHEAVFVYMVQTLPSASSVMRERFQAIAYSMLP